MLRQRRVWALIAVGIFVASLDFWRWDTPVESGPFGIPAWVTYFVALQFILAGATHIFSRTAWNDRGDPEDNE